MLEKIAEDIPVCFLYWSVFTNAIGEVFTFRNSKISKPKEKRKTAAVAIRPQTVRT